MAKRIASSSVNWGLLSEVVSPETKNAFIVFKSQSEKLLRDIAELPQELPKIDWTFYKSHISAPGIVDSYQKNYESLKIPYPNDQGWLAKVEAEEQKKSAEFEKVRLEGLKEIGKLKEKLKELEKEIPFVDSTLEELFLMRENFRITPDKPKLWPQFLFTKEELSGSSKSAH